MSDATVSDVGENALLELIRDRLPHAPEGETWSGDDAAVLDLPGRVVVTTDSLVEDIDFSFRYATGADAGWKAIASNASDVAAMGCAPSHAVVAVGMRPDTPLAVFEAILEGLTAAAGAFGVALVGGDLTEAPQVFLSVTMIGSGPRVVLRSGARPGDLICVTGHLGGAAGGLLVLQRGLDPSGAYADLIARQLRPTPPVAAGPVIAAAGATAMIDVSDGLAIDLYRLLEASGCGCTVDPSLIPVDPGLQALARAMGNVDTTSVALLGGEDYELLFTMPSDREVELRRGDLGRAGVIGRVGDGLRTIGDRSLDDWKESAWQHLRGL